MTEYSLEACIRAWRKGQSIAGSGTDENLGDVHFAKGDFEAAAHAYAACEHLTDQIKAKRGWCLAFIDQFDEAEQFLTSTTCGASSAELAVLAFVIAGGRNGHKLYRTSGTPDDAIARREQVSQLIDRALHAADKPDYLAFLAYKNLVEWHRDREAAVLVAERATSLFKEPSLIEWHARLLRWLGRPSNAALDALLAQMPEEPWGTYVSETFESGLALSRYDDAATALDVLEEKLKPELDPTFSSRLALMRSYVELRRALDSDPGAAFRGLAAAEQVSSDLSASGIADSSIDGLRLFSAKLRLALAVILGDERATRESAKAIIHTNWLVEDTPDSPMSCEAIFLGGVEFGAEFGAGYLGPEVTTSLLPSDQINWTLLKALYTLMFDDETDAGATEYVSAHGPSLAPAWAARIVLETLLKSEHPDPRGTGRALTRHCLHAERIDGSDASRPQFDYKGLPVAELSDLLAGVEDEFSTLKPDASESGWVLVGELGQFLWSKKAFHDLKRLTDLVLARAPDDSDSLFYGALSRQELKQLNEARSMYEQLLELDPDYRSAYWNVTLLYETQGDAQAIEKLLPLIEKRAAGGDQNWTKTRDLARAAAKRSRQHAATTDMRSFVRRVLATHPALRDRRIDASELSLLEAAGLLALFRASDLDHTTWVLAPFGSNSIPFEPTYRFRQVLLELVGKGIIRIAETTPIDAFTSKEGHLHYYLDRAHWSISPHTLALQRDIRDMAKDRWPEHWSVHAEALSRDLATEECVAYIEHLADERELNPPTQADARALFRELLEHCSASQCWYYIYSGVKSANDYGTKYPVSRAQVTSMMLKRTRELAERAIANGWDTAYRRIGAVPRSHLSNALHDVLTGWGERAFNEPIRTLPDPSSMDG